MAYGPAASQPVGGVGSHQTARSLMGGPGTIRTALLPVVSVRGVSGKRAGAALSTMRLPTTLVHVVLCTDVCHVRNSNWKVKKIVFTYDCIKNNAAQTMYLLESIL
jgi:hypothetical protein